MAVVHTTSYKPYPGKQGQMLERMNQSKVVLAKHGAEARILMNLAGGAGATTFAISVESLEHYGQVMQAAGQDPEMQAIQTAIAESPNAEVVSTDLWMDAG
jgi:hypothetical protein